LFDGKIHLGKSLRSKKQAFFVTNLYIKNKKEKPNFKTPKINKT
jgi:hypothetical protein